MKITKILTACTAALFFVGCSDKNDPNLPEPTPGADVLFGAALEAEPRTRTIYGEETNNQFPILWLNGDQVKVMSPECALKEGTYAVNLGTSSTGDQAGTLVKQGDAGVQWGNSATANFFSVYPAGHVTSMNPADRTMQCHFIHTQNDYLHRNANGSYTALADMNASFMSAATYDAPNGQSVNLCYKPISTALRFTLTGPSADNNDNVIISHVRLTAPGNKAIAGNFTLTFPESGNTDNTTVTPVITVPETADGTNNYDYVDVFSSYEGSEGGGFLTLGRGQSMELNAFVLLDKEVDITGWTIEVVLSNGVRFKKNLGGTAAADKSLTLVPGQIHRLPALPALNIPADQQDYDPSNWMVNIPRNTYLSEISIPGSWNSLNSDFQGNNPSLGAQYRAGARAFHLDCRWKDVNTLGIAAGSASSASGSGWDTSGGSQITNGQSFQAALDTIVNHVKEEEYMVLFCTFAQNSAVPTGKSWMEAISQACANAAKAEKIADASKINSKTTVGEVLNKVIVIVNAEGSVPTIAGSKCFFVNAPLSLKSNMFGNGVYGHDLLHYGSGTSDLILYTSQCQVEFQSHGLVYGSQGDDNSSRGYLPTQSQRQAQINAILDWSKTNYADKDNYTTSNWIYLGIGGYRGAYGSITGSSVHAVSDSYTAIANTYNNLINNRINNMSATPTGSQTNYYPVGIVLMNFVTNTTYGRPVVNNILQLNNKYQKAYDSTKPAWPNTGGSTQQNSPANYSSAHAAGGDAWIVNK